MGELNEQVVFVGGATVSLYVNDPAADDVRPTKDVDISLAIASLGELEATRRELTRKGFKQSSEDDVICRFRYDDIKVDVMNTRAIGWAPANPWFAPGFAHREMVLVEGQPIWILPLPPTRARTWIPNKLPICIASHVFDLLDFEINAFSQGFVRLFEQKSMLLIRFPMVNIRISLIVFQLP